MIYFDVSTLNPEKITGVGVYMLQLLQHFHKKNVAVVPVVKISRWKKKSAIQKVIPQKLCRFLFPVSLSRPELYHGPDFKLSTNGNFPRVVTVHDMVVFEQKYNEPEFYKKGIADLTATLTAKNLAAVIVNSQFTKKEVLKYFPQLNEKIHVTYLGCQREVLLDNIEKIELPEKYILFLGTLEKRKNVRGVIAAFDKFKKQGHPHKLILAGGNGFGSEEIENAIRDSDFSKDILRLYYVSDAHIRELYSRAEAFLFPSFYEGFGIPVLEAMALGCPVVTSLGGALDEITADAALKAAPEDTDQLATHLASIVTNPKLREDLKQKGLKRSAQFTWEKCATETLKIYQSIL